jgi:hypothetical protein
VSRYLPDANCTLRCPLVQVAASTEVSGLAAWTENCRWYSSLPLGAVVSLFCQLVSVVSFVAINLCVASQRVFVVVFDFVIDSVRKLLGMPSCFERECKEHHQFQKKRPTQSSVHEVPG